MYRTCIGYHLPVSRRTESVRPGCLSLRQSAHSGHSFPAPQRRPEPRRMRAFAVIHPNHGHRLGGEFWAFSRLCGALFSDATEPRRFWYGCQKIAISRTYRTSERTGFEGRPLRRRGLGSNNSVRYGSWFEAYLANRATLLIVVAGTPPSALAARRCQRSGPVYGACPIDLRGNSIAICLGAAWRNLHTQVTTRWVPTPPFRSGFRR
jgi:hypothetical protein